MLKFLLKTVTVYCVISIVSLALIDDRHGGRSDKADSHMVSLPSKEIDDIHQPLPNSNAEKDTASQQLPFSTEENDTIKMEVETVSNPVNSSHSGSDESQMRSYFVGLDSINVQNHIDVYGAVSEKENMAKNCIWYDHEHEKEHRKTNGSHWSGNGCKDFHCKNGVIIPDPSCCEIGTHLHGFISHYFLYQNHGQKWIKACELLTCDFGLIKKVNKIPGCCVYNYVHSKENGESWWAFSASSYDHNFCKKGTCNNGQIEIIQIEEGEVWEDGCFDYICEGSDFKMNKVDLPGACNLQNGNCMTNGSSVKYWKQCKGITCFNGKLFKRALQECSSK